ncbi:MAG: hypothetical protein EOO62_13825 [Hymenobacter sp.]|nr:MAG: hypothetical protein EOO62_13825 [Hymenobacter sp.]
MSVHFRKLALIGIGLIGSSIALAARRQGLVSTLGYGIEGSKLVLAEAVDAPHVPSVLAKPAEFLPFFGTVIGVATRDEYSSYYCSVTRLVTACSPAGCTVRM